MAPYPTPTSAHQVTKPAGKEMLSEAEIENGIRFQNWATNGVDVFWGSAAAVDTLPAGLYKCEYRDGPGICLVKQSVFTDEIIEIEDSDSTYITDEICQFWSMKEEFHKRGLLHKRGILLMGDPGSGKTSTIQLLIRKMIEEHQGIVIYPDARNISITTDCLLTARKLEPGRPILLIMEDFETMVESGKDENSWLAMLDGETQIDNIVFIATTNYIEKLDKRFTDRPSRFDTIKLVKMPSRKMRQQYLNVKEPTIAGEDLEMWLDDTEGFAISHIKEMIVSVKCFGRSYEQTLKRIKQMRKRKYNSDNFDGDGTSGSVGFGFASEDDD